MKHSKQKDRKKKLGKQYLGKIHYKTKSIKRDTEEHVLILQRKNPPRRHKYCKHICTQHRSTQIHIENLEDFKKDIDSNTIIVGDFYTPLSKMDRSSKQNIKKDIVSLNNTCLLYTSDAADETSTV